MAVEVVEEEEVVVVVVDIIVLNFLKPIELILHTWQCNKCKHSSSELVPRD